MATAVETNSDEIETITETKANKNHTHSISNITSLQSTLHSKANAQHTHNIADVGDLQDALNSKANATHSHNIADVGDLQNVLDGKADAVHSHNYAGSSSAGGAATSANKLNTNAGSATQPVYFSNGVPVNTTYTLNKSVPADAVFTDTTYTPGSLGAPIPANSDLNDYRTPGVYYSPNSNISATLTNAPTTQTAFIMEVKLVSNINYVIQEVYVPLGRVEVYRRRYVNGSWGSWSSTTPEVMATAMATMNSKIETLEANNAALEDCILEMSQTMYD